MKRQSKKSQYIADIVWELEHFKDELKRTEGSKEFRSIWYLGDKYTRFAAKKRVEELEGELQHIESDSTYTPWKEVSNA